MTRSVRILLIGIPSLAVLFFAPSFGMEWISPGGTDDMSRNIYWSLRIPRMLTGLFAGMILAQAGCVFQAIFRNPLSTPYTLGIASGASLGAATSIVLMSMGVLPLWFGTVPGAILGGLTATGLVLGISSLLQTPSPATILLAGIAVSYLFSSLLMFMQYLSNLRSSFHIIRWLMGGLEVGGYTPVKLLCPIAIAGGAFLISKAGVLNQFLTGAELAQSRGVDVRKQQTILYLATSLMVCMVVAYCGPIGFIGMMVPHMCRIFVGPDHRWLLPISAISGGAFLVACDTAARVVIAPAEIPVGVLTALLGGPFFLILLLWQYHRDKR